MTIQSRITSIGWRIWDDSSNQSRPSLDGWVSIIGSGPATIYRPISDISSTGWTGDPSSDLYSNIDEESLSDTDFILSPDLASGGPVIFALGGTLPAATYTARIRAKYTLDGGQIRVSLLNSSDVSQGTSSWQAVTASLATYNLPITTTGSATRVRIEIQT